MLNLLTNYYIPWDVNLFSEAAKGLRSTIGVAFNTGIVIFFLISGVYLVIKIVSSIGE